MGALIDRIRRRRGRVRFFVASAFFFLVATVAVAVESGPTTATQGELAARLVKGLGLAGGLPEEPKQSDYEIILAGRRTHRFEAEEVYNAGEDGVSVKNYPLYGPFTGAGWVSGVTRPVTVRFNFRLPRDGDYLLKAVSRGDGQKWSAAGREFAVNSGTALRQVSVGMVPLRAGKQEITVTLPPEGGVDSFTLVADDLSPVEPLAGWRADAPLTWGELAEVLAPLMGVEQNLPVDPAVAPLLIAAHGTAGLPAGAAATDSTFLGMFTAPKWVRAGVNGAVIEVPLDIAEAGLYGIRVRLLGKNLALEIDGKRFVRQGKPFLDWYDLGVQRLRQGRHLMKIELPPLGGIDVIEVVKRKSSPGDYLAATGLKGVPRATLSRTDLDTVLPGVFNRLREVK